MPSTEPIKSPPTPATPPPRSARSSTSARPERSAEMSVPRDGWSRPPMPSSTIRAAPCPRSSMTPHRSTPSTDWPTARRSPTPPSSAPPTASTFRLKRQAEGPVLVIHDTTELDYTSITSLTGLGQIGSGGGRGYLCHNTLAVGARTRTVLGLANQILAAAITSPRTSPARRSATARPARAGSGGRGARRWPGPPARHGSTSAIGPTDTFEYIGSRHNDHASYIVRSQHDRRCTLPRRRRVSRQAAPARTHARGVEPLGGRYVPVQAQKKQPARLAKVLIAASAVELLAPRATAAEPGRPLPVNLVVVREVEPPAGRRAAGAGSSCRTCRRATSSRRAWWSTGTGTGRSWRSCTSRG